MVASMNSIRDITRPSRSRSPGARLRGMTLKERLRRLVAKDHGLNGAGPTVNAEEPPEMASAPASWGWDKTAWGEPMPNVVAWLAQSRQGR
jgi:hypothetical protein